MADETQCARAAPFARGGMTAADRHRPELSAAGVAVDPRGLADLIAFGRRFAAHLTYYDETNHAAGDWTAFFDGEPTVALARLARLPVAPSEAALADLADWLAAVPARDPALLAAHLKLWMHVPLGLVAEAADAVRALPAGNDLRRAFPERAARELAPGLARLAALDHAAQAPAVGFWDAAGLAPSEYNTDGAPGVAGFRLTGELAGVVDDVGFASRAIAPLLFAALPQDDWPAFHAAQPADAMPFDMADPASPRRVFDQVVDVLGYAPLTEAVARTLAGLDRVRRDAGEQLRSAVTDFSGHAPQTGLWLAFLRLYAHAQTDLNAFPLRHLNFHFRDVLGLTPRPARPDTVHVVFTLAKGQAARRLAAGTALLAGKDAGGVSLRYALDNDIVVTPARVAELAGLRLSAEGGGLVPRVAPVLASSDGLGDVPLPDDAPAFAPFGPPGAPPARVGFAVGDRALFLREGTREITLRVHLDRMPSSPPPLAGAFSLSLSGAEGWIEVPVSAAFGREETASGPETRTLADTFWTGALSREGAARGAARIGALLQGAPPRQVSASPSVTAAPPPRREAVVAQDTGGRRLVQALRGAGRTARPGPLAAGDFRARPRVGRPYLELTATLGPDAPAIVPVAPDLHGDDHAPGLPVAEIAFDFRDGTGGAAAFAALRDLGASGITVQTAATGLRNLSVLADGGVADPAKPFDAFGPRPRKGATLHLGSAELFAKRLASLTLNLEWAQRYTESGYFYDTAPSAYDASVSVLSGGTWTPSAAKTALRLDRTDRVSVAVTGAELIDGAADMTPDNPALDAASTTGYLRLELGADFGHDAFPLEQTRALMALAGEPAYTPAPGVNTHDPAAATPGRFVAADRFEIADASPRAAPSRLRLSESGRDATGEVPRAPFTPRLEAIDVSYRSAALPVTAFSQLGPFGARPAASDGRLFPDLGFAGAIHLGVEGFEGPARLSLLVQVADGTGDPLLLPPPLKIERLEGNTWRALAEADVTDATGGLVRSGLIWLDLPRAETSEQTVMPAGMTWLRLSVAQDPGAVNRLLSVRAQAARARFADQGNDPRHLAEPLAPGRVARLDPPDPAIKSVAQPFPTFGGHAEEDASAFRVRVSERLRHKDRAVTMWDMEALVLEAFPQLHRVRCLATTRLARGAAGAVSEDGRRPGSVTVVTVPRTGPGHAVDPRQPFTDQATLADVAAFLRWRLPPFVALEVANPVFEEIALDFTVRFRAGIGDTAFYRSALHDALQQFLMPWSRDGGEIAFGGRLYKSAIIDFLDERPEVDFVTDVAMYHAPDPSSGGRSNADLDVAVAQSARAILVPARSHVITVAEDAP